MGVSFEVSFFTDFLVTCHIFFYFFFWGGGGPRDFQGFFCQSSVGFLLTFGDLLIKL